MTESSTQAPTEHRADVIVVGAGPAGFPAASGEELLEAGRTIEGGMSTRR